MNERTRASLSANARLALGRVYFAGAATLFVVASCGRRDSPAPTSTRVPAELSAVVSAEPASELAALASASGSTPVPVASAPTEATSARPTGMVTLGRFAIDRYEAHLVTVGDDGVERSFPHYRRPDAGVRYEARSTPGVYPQAYVNRVEAAAACENAGKRLCTFTEWERACQGPRNWSYPYGPRPKSKACNSGKPHLLSIFFGANAGAWKYNENFNNPLLNQEPGYLAKTGEYDACAGDDGIYDLVGNLHEWVSDTAGEDLIVHMASDNTSRRHQPVRPGNGVFLGGFFSTTSELGEGCRYLTAAHEPTYHDYSLGFRCCRSVGEGEAKP